ncbi:hypothetical protein [Paraburkholderia sp. C35]|uniref:hypothetical protein n=1 Tax=Paraburkholderia sp. C35 TaxID=2126993 RepID=UPI000D69485A|nr:hypothetical protein [Paraburkholderia sp. C35]
MLVSAMPKQRLIGGRHDPDKRIKGFARAGLSVARTGSDRVDEFLLFAFNAFRTDALWLDHAQTCPSSA